MAVTTTVQEILDVAYAKSKRNVPGQIATEATELLDVVGRAQRGLYALATRVNPLAFAVEGVLPSGAGATNWDWNLTERPSGTVVGNEIEAFLRLENPLGTEVVVVPFDQRDIEPGMPAVYYMGPRFYPAGNLNDPDPTSDSLAAWYAKRPAMFTDLTDTLDEDWREGFNELLALEVAVYLALKDERGAELGELKQQRDRWLTQFVSHLEHAVAFERRSWGHFRVINTNRLIPLSSLVAGGTEAV